MREKDPLLHIRRSQSPSEASSTNQMPNSDP